MSNFAKHLETIFHVGDTVEVHYKLIEKEKVSGKAKREVKEEIRERVQIFEGIVIAIKGHGEGKSFTVRRIGTAGIGIERIFPLNSPWIKSIKVKKTGKVRRAKLYYLRTKSGKEVEKLKEKTKANQNEKKQKQAKKGKIKEDIDGSSKELKPHEKKQ